MIPLSLSEVMPAPIWNPIFPNEFMDKMDFTLGEIVFSALVVTDYA